MRKKERKKEKVGGKKKKKLFEETHKIIQNKGRVEICRRGTLSIGEKKRETQILMEILIKACPPSRSSIIAGLNLKFEHIIILAQYVI